MRDWRTLASRYSDDERRLIVDFYARMEQVFRAHLVRPRDGEAPGHKRDGGAPPRAQAGRPPGTSGMADRRDR
jgi:hypothetical protein